MQYRATITEIMLLYIVPIRLLAGCKSDHQCPSVQRLLTSSLGQKLLTLNVMRVQTHTDRGL